MTSEKPRGRINLFNSQVYIRLIIRSFTQIIINDIIQNAISRKASCHWRSFHLTPAGMRMRLKSWLWGSLSCGLHYEEKVI
jgi:hypothetical protein